MCFWLLNEVTTLGWLQHRQSCSSIFFRWEPVTNISFPHCHPNDRCCSLHLHHQKSPRRKEEGRRYCGNSRMTCVCKIPSTFVGRAVQTLGTSNRVPPFNILVSLGKNRMQITAAPVLGVVVACARAWHCDQESPRRSIRPWQAPTSCASLPGCCRVGGAGRTCAASRSPFCLLRRSRLQTWMHMTTTTISRSCCRGAYAGPSTLARSSFPRQPVALTSTLLNAVVVATAPPFILPLLFLPTVTSPPSPSSPSPPPSPVTVIFVMVVIVAAILRSLDALPREQNEPPWGRFRYATTERPCNHVASYFQIGRERVSGSGN